MTIKPGTLDIEIDRSGTFDYTLTWKDKNNALINLTGFTAKMMIKKSVDDSVALVTLTDTAGLTLGGAAGTIRMVIDKAVTATLPNCLGVYDLRMTSPSGAADYLIQGVANIKKMVTV